MLWLIGTMVLGLVMMFGCTYLGVAGVWPMDAWALLGWGGMALWWVSLGLLNLGIPDDFWRGSALTLFVLGTIGLIKYLIDNWTAERAYNALMTDMMNSVPASQRFGYADDFPKNQRWE